MPMGFVQLHYPSETVSSWGGFNVCVTLLYVFDLVYREKKLLGQKATKYSY